MALGLAPLWCAGAQHGTHACTGKAGSLLQAPLHNQLQSRGLGVMARAWHLLVWGDTLLPSCCAWLLGASSPGTTTTTTHKHTRNCQGWATHKQ